MNAQWQEVSLRLVSGIVLAVAVLFITWWNPISFNTMCILGGAILAREWWRLTAHRSRWLLLFGAIYVGAAIGSLIFLRSIDEMPIYLLFALVWAGDTGAYAVGKLIGRHKIAPKISPGKSWEGLAGSIIATTAIVVFYSQRYEAQFLVINLGIGSLFAIVGLAGDLFESSLKRRAGVKDSGKLIPGHGGLFDRVDSLMPCAILLVLFTV